MSKRLAACRLRLIFALLACCATCAPMLARGADSSMLLVASEAMKDPRFRQTVVLVTRHGKSRPTIGVIVNRRLDTTLDRMFPQSASATSHRLHVGGPVAAGQIVFLVRADAAPSASITVAERVYLSSHHASLKQLVDAGMSPAQLRVFAGFSSWAQGQLENELARGDWHVLPVDADALFSDALENLWPTLWRRATQVRVRLSGPELFAAGSDAGIRLARH